MDETWTVLARATDMKSHVKEVYQDLMLANGSSHLKLIFESPNEGIKIPPDFSS